MCEKLSHKYPDKYGTPVFFPRLTTVNKKLAHEKKELKKFETENSVML